MHRAVVPQHRHGYTAKSIPVEILEKIINCSLSGRLEPAPIENDHVRQLR
jgi:hypothetical protein